MNPLGIIVDIGCVNIVNKYQQKLFRCEASLLVGVSVRLSRQVLKSYII